MTITVKPGGKYLARNGARVSVEEVEYMPGKKSLWATFYHSISSPVKKDGSSIIRMPENAYDLVEEITEEKFLEYFTEDEKEVVERPPATFTATR